jgi:hypothetical protein
LQITYMNFPLLRVHMNYRVSNEPTFSVEKLGPTETRQLIHQKHQLPHCQYCSLSMVQIWRYTMIVCTGLCGLLAHNLPMCRHPYGVFFQTMYVKKQHVSRDGDKEGRAGATPPYGHGFLKKLSHVCSFSVVF